MNALFARIPARGRQVALWMLTCALGVQVINSEDIKPRYRADRLIVMPKRGADSPALRKVHLQGGRRVLNAYPNLGDLQVIQLAPGEKLAEAALQYKSSGLVEFVEPDYKLHATAIPNDPEFTGGTQWSLQNKTAPGHDISAVDGWETLHSASNVVVAIIDSGIRYTHTDLAANVWTNPKEIDGNGIDDDKNGIVDDVHGINAIELNGNVMDDAGHGTHVAGIIGAVGNNGEGIAGVAWSVQLMGCKFLDKNGDGDTSDAIRCVDYARKNGASIINASWGGADYSAALNTAIANARAAGLIFVTAAGNDSVNIDEVPLYPACYTLDNIVVVGGTGRSDSLDPNYSNYGAVNVDLCAPGSGIYSTWNSWDGAYTYLSGTSMSAPHVAGVLALMKARFPGFSAIELINRLYSTVDVLPSLSGKCKTGGRVNLSRALGGDPTANFSVSAFSGEPPLMLSFTNTTLGQLQSLSWDFGDGSAVTTNPNPSHVFAKRGEFVVKLSVMGTNGRSSSVQQKISVRSNYEIVSEPYAWVDPTGMPQLTLSDNGVSPAQPLPFDFKFYDASYDAIYVSANGVLGFYTPGLAATSNASIPNSANPNGIICPYWDNFNPAAGGAVYFGTSGEAPNRRVVISWVEVPRNSTGVPLTFQAILEEGSNEIVFQYLDVKPETSRGGAKGATIGIENAMGTLGALYTMDGVPHILANETALRVQPHGYRYLLADAAQVELAGVTAHGISSTAASLNLTNPGTLDLDWSLSAADPWVTASPTNGTLHAGESVAVQLGLSAESDTFGAGVHATQLTLKNVTDGSGDQTIPLELKVQEARAMAKIQNVSGTMFTGGLGGPFSPGTQTLELLNAGNVPFDWEESAEPAWLLASPSSGTLQPGDSQVIEVTLGPGSEDLLSGTSTSTMTFSAVIEPFAPAHQSFQVQVRSRVVQTAASISNGIFRGMLEVSGGSTYEVEYSDDLRKWLPLQGASDVSNGALTFEDSTMSGQQRFYRVRIE